MRIGELLIFAHLSSGLSIQTFVSPFIEIKLERIDGNLVLRAIVRLFGKGFTFCDRVPCYFSFSFSRFARFSVFYFNSSEREKEKERER